MECDLFHTHMMGHYHVTQPFCLFRHIKWSYVGGYQNEFHLSVSKYTDNMRVTLPQIEQSCLYLAVHLPGNKDIHLNIAMRPRSLSDPR